MKASVVVATYNRENDLIRVIKSVLEQSYESFELIIVDQTVEHSKTTQKFLNSVNDTRFRYYHVSPPSTPAARNYGILKAKGNIIIFIDDDVVLDPNFITEHVKVYIDKKVGGVAGRIRVPGQPESKMLYHITPTGWNVGGFDYGYNSIAYSGPRGCNMSFRRSVLRKLNGFDTGYVNNAHREDSDMGYRVMAEGLIIRYSASASLTHYHTASGGSRSNSGLFYDVSSFANDFRFFYKNMNYSRKILLGYYFMHLVYVVPNPNPLIFFKRLYYLVVGSNIAKHELHTKINPIISTENLPSKIRER